MINQNPSDTVHHRNIRAGTEKKRRMKFCEAEKSKGKNKLEKAFSIPSSARKKCCAFFSFSDQMTHRPSKMTRRKITIYVAFLLWSLFRQTIGGLYPILTMDRRLSSEQWETIPWLNLRTIPGYNTKPPYAQYKINWLVCTLKKTLSHPFPSNHLHAHHIFR